MATATQERPPQWGITNPIRLDGPSATEAALTKSLMEELRRQNIFEDEDEIKNREVILGRISALVKNFVFTVSKSRGMSDAVARASGGKIFTFGSYQLGVHGPGDDIDCLLVVPKHVSRDDFWTTFLPMLQATQGVTQVMEVPQAYVPIIKCKISGVEVDFLCARLGLSSIPDDLDLSDDNLLKNLDERCVRSLGGPRVTDEILRLVPNVEVFRDALRCIKLWARRRAIYSKVLGFFGGVAWAVLVARICQLYPNRDAGAIVSRFFMIMYQWKWPQPVLLKPIGDGPLGVKVWNPMLYPQDRLHRMPLISPVYPYICLTHNISASTQEIMIQECKRADEVVIRIYNEGAPWSELFEKHDFFSRYRYYIQVLAVADSAENLAKWSGSVESKLRRLVLELEFVKSVKLVHPYVTGFERAAHYINDEEVSEVAFNRISDAVTNRTQEEAAKEPNYRTVYTSTFYIGLVITPEPALLGYLAGHVGPQRLDISYPTSEFKRICKQWELFDANAMGLHVTAIKNAQLPNWVFEGGVRPGLKVAKRPKPAKVRREKQREKQQPISPVETSSPTAESAAFVKHRRRYDF